MWTLITNCSKQLTIHSKLREKAGEQATVYEISGFESDKFKLKLLEKNNVVAAEQVELYLTCAQLMQYGFEVETAG